MNENIRMACGLISLLIGAGLLTHLTRNSDHILSYESVRTKKESKKKRQMETSYPVSVNENNGEIVSTNAPPLE